MASGQTRSIIYVDQDFKSRGTGMSQFFHERDVPVSLPIPTLGIGNVPRRLDWNARTWRYVLSRYMGWFSIPMSLEMSRWNLNPWYGLGDIASRVHGLTIGRLWCFWMNAWILIPSLVRMPVFKWKKYVRTRVDVYLVPYLLFIKKILGMYTGPMNPKITF